jgi:outer membrane receptor protein involved in Fe transport
VALQKSQDGLDWQTAFFSRYSSVNFVPDINGDLFFNGVASNVYRSSFVNGLQTDAAYKVNDAHTLRAGFQVSGEQTTVANNSVVLPGDGINGPCFGAPQCNVIDGRSKLGWLFGTYIQDQWSISNALTLNVGLRFDQMYQFVDANQFSPRVGVVYKPFEGITFHAGYARNFTPPQQVIATPANVVVFNNTSAQPEVTASSPLLPERSHVFDVGVSQIVLPGLTVGLDAYYKIAQDLLDDGQFGQALVLSGFNYAKGENEGLELKVNYVNGNFRAYGNLAWAHQKATQVVSNHFLFGQDELDYIANHWVYTDHAQVWTGSAGVSYLWNGTRFSADMIYGSGLRSGFANTDHLPAYGQVNVGMSREITQPHAKPLTVRFDVVNVFDTIYQIRDGSGIGVFAPQFGPRRGYFIGLSQKL